MSCPPHPSCHLLQKADHLFRWYPCVRCGVFSAAALRHVRSRPQVRVSLKLTLRRGAERADHGQPERQPRLRQVQALAQQIAEPVQPRLEIEPIVGRRRLRGRAARGSIGRGPIGRGAVGRRHRVGAVAGAVSHDGTHNCSHSRRSRAARRRSCRCALAQGTAGTLAARPRRSCGRCGGARRPAPRTTRRARAPRPPPAAQGRSPASGRARPASQPLAA